MPLAFGKFGISEMPMDYEPVIKPLLNMLWWLLPVVILITLFKSSWMKGYIGELLVRLWARLFLPRDVYHPMHDVTLPTLDGTTQIDHIFVSRFGIFVVETKNMRGWIFGSESQAQWTQTMFKKTFKFQNPLRQNYKHLKTLESALDIPIEVIHSVIAFVGDSMFKTEMPANVAKGGRYVTYIKSFKQEVLSAPDVDRIVQQIQQGRLEPGRATNKAHVQNLKTRANPEAERSCPACGSALVIRQVKKGANVGKQFWGCSGYPKCHVKQALG